MEHKRENCSTRYSDFVNKFRYDDFPELDTTSQPDQEEGENQADPESVSMASGVAQQESSEQPNDSYASVVANQQENVSGMDDILPASQVTVPEVNINTGDMDDSVHHHDESVDESVTDTKIQVEVLHSAASQNVRGALASPIHGDVTETASEPEIVLTQTPRSTLGSGITPGQAEKVVQVKGAMGSQVSSVATEELLVSQASQSMDGVTEIVLSEVENLQLQDTASQGGFWTVYGNKRKASKGHSTSSDEDHEKTVKASFGSFATSIMGTGREMFRKKMKEFDGD